MKRNTNLTKEQRELLVKIWEEHKDKTAQAKTDYFNNIQGTTFCYSTLVKFYNFYKLGLSDGIKKSASEVQLKRLGKAQANLMLKQKENTYARKEFHKIARKSVLTENFKNILIKTYKKHNKTKWNIERKVKNNEMVMLVINSDLQIGKEVNTQINSYNEKILNERQDKFLNKAYFYAKLYGIDNIIHLDMGDSIDNNAMRPGHYNDLESNYTSLVAQYKKWLDFRLQTLSFLNKFAKVKFAGVPSNHCRMNGNKLLNNPLDDFSYLHNDTINRILPDSELKVNTIDKVNGLFHFNILGKDIFISHGDKMPSKPDIHKSNWVNHLKTNYGIKNVDLLITGHYHHFFSNEEHLGVGSIVGVDTFALQFGLSSKPSQAIVLISNEEITQIPIFL